MNFRLNPNLDIKLRSWLGGGERVGVASWNNTFVEYLFVLLFLKRFKAHWDFFLQRFKYVIIIIIHSFSKTSALFLSVVMRI